MGHTTSEELYAGVLWCNIGRGLAYVPSGAMSLHHLAIMTHPSLLYFFHYHSPLITSVLHEGFFLTLQGILLGRYKFCHRPFCVSLLLLLGKILEIGNTSTGDIILTVKLLGPTFCTVPVLGLWFTCPLPFAIRLSFYRCAVKNTTRFQRQSAPACGGLSPLELRGVRECTSSMF